MNKVKIIYLEIGLSEVVAGCKEKIESRVNKAGFKIIDSSHKGNHITISAEKDIEGKHFSTDALVRLHTKLIKVSGVKSVEANVYSHQITLRSDKQ